MHKVVRQVTVIISSHAHIYNKETSEKSRICLAICRHEARRQAKDAPATVRISPPADPCLPAGSQAPFGVIPKDIMTGI